MTKEELKRKVSDGESFTVEFKKCRNGLGEGIFETVCAFLNRTGGEDLTGFGDLSGLGYHIFK